MIRLLDPMLCRLIGDGKTLRDLSVTIHLVDALTTLLRSGDKNTAKACQVDDPRKSPYVLVAGQTASNYSELLSGILIK